MSYKEDTYVTREISSTVYVFSDFELNNLNTDCETVTPISDGLYQLSFTSQTKIEEKCEPLLISYSAFQDETFSSEEEDLLAHEQAITTEDPVQVVCRYYKALEPYRLPSSIPEHFTAMPDTLARYILRCRQQGMINGYIQRKLREGDYGFF